jgi:hypothetical protein
VLHLMPKWSSILNAAVGLSGSSLSSGSFVGSYRCGENRTGTCTSPTRAKLTNPMTPNQTMRTPAFLSIVVVALAAIACSGPSRPPQSGTGGSGDSNGGASGNTVPDGGQGGTGDAGTAPGSQLRVFTGPPFGFGFANPNALIFPPPQPCEETCGPYGHCVVGTNNSKYCECDNGLETTPCVASCKAIGSRLDIDLGEVLVEVQLRISVGGVPVRDGVVSVSLEYGPNRFDTNTSEFGLVAKGKYNVYYNGMKGVRTRGDDAPTHSRLFLGDVEITEPTTLNYDLPRPVRLTGDVTLAGDDTLRRPVLTALDPKDKLVEFGNAVDGVRGENFAYVLPGRYLVGYYGGESIVHVRELVIEPNSPVQDISFSVPTADTEMTVTLTFGGMLSTNGTLIVSGLLGSIDFKPDGPGRFRGTGVPGSYYIEFFNSDRSSTRWPRFDSYKTSLVVLKAGDNTFDQPLVNYTGTILADGPTETLSLELRGTQKDFNTTWKGWVSPAPDGSFSIEAPAVKVIEVSKPPSPATFAFNRTTIASIDVEGKLAFEIDYRGVNVSVVASQNGVIDPPWPKARLGFQHRLTALTGPVGLIYVDGTHFDGLAMPGSYWLSYSNGIDFSVTVPLEIPQTGITKTVDFRVATVSGHISGFPSHQQPFIRFKGDSMDVNTKTDTEKNFTANFPVGNYYLDGYSAAGCFKIE